MAKSKSKSKEVIDKPWIPYDRRALTEKQRRTETILDHDTSRDFKPITIKECSREQLEWLLYDAIKREQDISKRLSRVFTLLEDIMP